MSAIVPFSSPPIAVLSVLLAVPRVFPAATLHIFNLARPAGVWSHVVADVAISASYAAIFAGLAWASSKLREVPQLTAPLREFTVFGVFLVIAAATRFAEAITPWWPIEHFALELKTASAFIAVPAAILLVWKLPAIIGGISELTELLSIAHRQTEALRKSEAFLDRTGRIAGIGGWEIDLLTREMTWSVETYRIHGASLDYLPTLEESIAFYTADCQPTITAAVEHACATGEGWDLELSGIRLDGRQIWVRTFGVAELRDGKPIRLAGAFQDITERVAERLALKEANDRLTLATGSGGIGIWEWDLVDGVLNCDKWMHRLHGRRRANETCDVMQWKEQVHPEDKEFVVQAMRDAIEGTRPYDAEFRIIWPDRSIHHLRATAQVTRDAAGNALRMVGANWDITEARKLSSELARQHELLRVTLRSIGDGVITTDAACNVVWLNPVAERMTGWTNADAYGKPLPEIFCILNYETRETVENPVVACLANGEISKLAADTILIARDGTRVGIDDSAAPIRGERGELLGAVLVFHDVTEQRRLFAETSRIAKVELKLKDDFLSRVSHELRSPLTSIYSFTSIIADNLAGETTPQQQEYLDIVLKNAGQLQSMIEDLLLITQANEGKLSIELQRASLSEAVMDALHTIQIPAERKQIRLTHDFASFLPDAFADPTRMTQILIILLDNAVKFTPVGGKISVQVSERDSEFLLVEVSDSGCGIPPEKRVRVFENLYQITGPNQPDTEQNGRNGLGLGLHIARDLVTRQGGEIWITGEIGQGSVFSFTLPIFLEDSEHAVPLMLAASSAVDEVAIHA